MSANETITDLTNLVKELAEQNRTLLAQLQATASVRAPGTAPVDDKQFDMMQSLSRGERKYIEGRRAPFRTEWILGCISEDACFESPDGKKHYAAFDVKTKNGAIVDLANFQYPAGWDESHETGGICPYPKDQCRRKENEEPADKITMWAWRTFAQAVMVMANTHRRLSSEMRESADPTRNAPLRNKNGWVAPDDIYDAAAE